MVVLVSSSVYVKKKEIYSKFPHCRVYPLLLDWHQLTGEMIKEIMGVGQAGDQLYVSVIMNLLRRWQMDDRQPPYDEFLSELQNGEFSKQQSGPMNQRLQLLSSILRDAKENAKLRDASVPVQSLFRPGSFVIVDSSNPLVTQNEANSVFHVMLQMFMYMSSICTKVAYVLSSGTNLEGDCGRLVVLDEAHKYIGKDHGELGETLLECIRQMRHHGLRVVISTQDPSSLTESMLELATFVVMHFFSAPTWFKHLSKALPLKDAYFDVIQRFARHPGNALVYCARSSVQMLEGEVDSPVFPVHIRKRITADAGASRRHTASSGPPTPVGSPLPSRFSPISPKVIRSAIPTKVKIIAMASRHLFAGGTHQFDQVYLVDEPLALEGWLVSLVISLEGIQILGGSMECIYSWGNIPRYSADASVTLFAFVYAKSEGDYGTHYFRTNISETIANTMSDFVDTLLKMHPLKP